MSLGQAGNIEYDGMLQKKGNICEKKRKDMWYDIGSSSNGGLLLDKGLYGSGHNHYLFEQVIPQLIP